MGNTNIRVGYGVYSLLKDYSEKSGISIGNLCNLIVIGSLISENGKAFSNTSEEIRKALVSDALSVLGEVVKHKGFEAIRDMTLWQFYQSLSQ